MVKDIYSRSWIIENAKQILSGYPERITIRQLHYRLVSIGMINDLNHYKRVVDAMTGARWDNVVSMEAFIDRDRSMFGETKDDEKNLEKEIVFGKVQVSAWMNAYRLNRWSNQDYYIEVWIEKKALQGVFEGPCENNEIGLAPCKGYPSITFLYEAKGRFEDAIDNEKEAVILYFGDYDPSGEDIPRSIKENLGRMGVDVAVERIALNPNQIKEMALPGVPPKSGDSRSNNWNGGAVVELDAIEPNTLKRMCEDAIKVYFDQDRFTELQERESTEQGKYREALKEYVKTLGKGAI